MKIAVGIALGVVLSWLVWLSQLPLIVINHYIGDDQRVALLPAAQLSPWTGVYVIVGLMIAVLVWRWLSWPTVLLAGIVVAILFFPMAAFMQQLALDAL